MDKINDAIISIGPFLADELSIRKYLTSQQDETVTQSDKMLLPSTPLISLSDTYRYDQLMNGVG